MSNLPVDIANQSLDAAGVDFTLGDLQEGTRPAQVILRAYGECRKQLLRGVHWNFARFTAPMTLLADRTGQTPNVGTLITDQRFRFMYSYPTNCLKMRFVPQNNLPFGTAAPPGNIQPADPNAPLMTGAQQIGWGRIVPARFCESSDANYPPPPGQVTWEVQGVSPQTRTVILTNVQNASACYTMDVLYPSVWDPLFRAGLVSYIASEIALPLAEKTPQGKRMALEIRKELIASTKAKITQARISDGNEGVFSSDIPVDWINVRRTGGYGYGGGAAGFGGGWGGGDDCGVLSMGWSACGFADGSAY